MSIDRNVYLGPYLRCRVVNVPDVEESRSCPDPACRAYRAWPGDAAHCPACGAKIAVVAFPVERPRVASSEAAEAIGEALHAVDDVPDLRDGPDADHVFWLPNRDRPGKPDGLGGIDGTESGVTRVGPRDIEADVRWFDAAFAPELAKLDEMYGEENCEAGWGLVSHES